MATCSAAQAKTRPLVGNDSKENEILNFLLI